MKVSARLGGWWRLWILLSLIWVCIALVEGFSQWPSEPQAVHHPAFIYQLDLKQRELLARDKSQPAGLGVTMPNGHFLEFRVGVDESAAKSVARAYQEITVRAQADARSALLWYVVFFALAPCIVVAALGLGIAWVRRGFRQVAE